MNTSEQIVELLSDRKNLDSFVETSAEAIHLYRTQLEEERQRTGALASLVYDETEKLLSTEPGPEVEDVLLRMRKEAAQLLRQQWEDARDAVFAKVDELGKVRQVSSIPSSIPADIRRALQAEMVVGSPLLQQWIVTHLRGQKITTWGEFLETLMECLGDRQTTFAMLSSVSSETLIEQVNKYIDWAEKEVSRVDKEFNSIMHSCTHPSDEKAEQRLRDLGDTFFQSGEFGHG